jgi:hypothetical protein
MKDLYAAADGCPKKMLGKRSSTDPPKWIQLQKYAFSDDPFADEKLQKVVQEMIQLTVQQPIYRKVREDGAGQYTFDGKEVILKEGQAIILDMVR